MPKPSQYSLICSTRQLPFYSALLRTSSFLTLNVRDTPTKLLKHFISALLIRHASAPYNDVGTITPSYRRFLAFIPNPLLLRTIFCASQPLYPHSFCVLHPSDILHQLPLARASGKNKKEFINNLKIKNQSPSHNNTQYLYYYSILILILINTSCDNNNTTHFATYRWYKGYKIKSRNHLRHGTQYQTNRNLAQSLQENAITQFWSHL